MKQNLLNKFSGCLPVGMAFIATAMMFSVSANAQIVYTDVIPDDIISCSFGPCSDSVNVDLNNDGSMDFILTYNLVTVSPCRHGVVVYIDVVVSTIGANSFYGIALSNPSALNYGNIIDSNHIWSNGTGLLRESNSNCLLLDTSGNWRLMTDQYLPVKISITGNNYFGWIRMQMDLIGGIIVNGFVLKDYAYNSTPNQFILAGDTVLGPTGIIETFASSSINLFPNPATNQLTITLESSKKKVELTIADITGKIIYKTTASETQQIEVNTNDFAEGIYAVQIQTADYIGTKKLVIEK